ncbi:zinc ABC transporter substrate-binding protein [Roseovarius sp. C7]|uniref:zinc ABC transporter substrate-binding protein n=1 Tax=Roseovarius sp. C7 TaxID=3398643 RepID=UPI0039F4D284
MTETGKGWAATCAVLVGLGLPMQAMAEPAVVTDIAPVESLVARVMQGAGAPDRLVPRGASPHDARLKPSDAAALAKADLVFMIGAGLTPWLSEAQQSLAPEAHVIRLMEVDGSTVLPSRNDVEFGHEGHEEHEEHGDHEGHEGHEHDDDHAAHGHDDHGHDDHGDDDHEGHGHDDHEEHEDHEGHEEHEGHAGHDHGLNDPHGWLDPENARVWLRVIAAELSEKNPENAELYQENLALALAEITAAEGKARALLEPVKDRPFVVSHDAFQYFETAFDVTAAGAIALSDARAPGPKRVAEIRDVLAKRGVVCVLTEPGSTRRWPRLWQKPRRRGSWRSTRWGWSCRRGLGSIRR